MTAIWHDRRTEANIPISKLRVVINHFYNHKNYYFYAIRKSNLSLLISIRIRESLNQQDILNAHLLHLYITLYKLHLTEPTYSFDFSYLIWPLKSILSIYSCVGTGILSLQHKGRTLQPGEVYMPGRPMPKVVYMLIGTRISIVRSRIGSFFV